MHFPKIKHPEWLQDSQCESTWRLYRQGIIPEKITGWMLVVAMKHDLRAIYGSDLRAALALLWHVIAGKLDSASYGIRSKIGLLSKIEREVEEDSRRMDAEHQKINQ